MTNREQLNTIGAGYLPSLFGLEVLSAEAGRVTNRLTIRQEFMAPNGFLHAATIIALADTACGYGVEVSFPEGANSFTTIELKTNFLGTARAGILLREAFRQRHNPLSANNHASISSVAVIRLTCCRNFFF